MNEEIKEWYFPVKEYYNWREYAGKRMVSYIRSFFINAGFMAPTKTDTHPVTGEELDNE